MRGQRRKGYWEMDEKRRDEIREKKRIRIWEGSEGSAIERKDQLGRRGRGPEVADLCGWIGACCINGLQFCLHIWVSCWWKVETIC